MNCAGEMKMYGGGSVERGSTGVSPYRDGATRQGRATLLRSFGRWLGRNRLGRSLALPLLLAVVYAQAADVITNVMSPVVSYQYFNDLGSEALTNGGVMSPVASYQYFDRLDGASLAQQTSQVVSYFYNVWGGAQSVILTGRVLDTAGASVAGATVSAAVVEISQTSTTTAEDGTYQLPALPAGVYVLTAAKAGYTRDQRAVSFSAGTAPQNFGLRPAVAPPVTQDTGNAPPFTAPAPSDIEGSALVAFDGTQFVPVTGPLDANKMTIVLTHGWNSRPEDWPLTLAGVLKNKGLLPLANIVAWDWHMAAAQVLPPEEKAPKQGVALGKALYQALGSGYPKPVHLVGHSLGTLLHAYTANYLHGDGDGRQERAATPWSFAQMHLTLFDEAEISRTVGQEVIFDVLGRVYKNGLNLPLASSLAAIKNALKGWKTPVPKRSAWVDNYISSVGIYHPDAVNASLLRGLLDNFGNPIIAHGYPQQWYAASIARPTVSTMGFRRSFEYRLLPEGAASVFPPPESELVLGDAQGQVLTAPDELTLEPLPYTRFGELLAPGLTYGPAIGYGSVVLELAGVANKAYNVTVDYVETAALTTMDAVNSLTDALEKGYQQTADLLNRQTLRLLLRTGSSGGAGVMQPRVRTANSNAPAYVWLPIVVPADAVAMAFDFKLIGDGVDDALVFGVNGTNLFTLETRFLADGESSTSRMLDVTPYAGRTNEFFFGLLGGTSTDCTVEVQNIRFYTLTPPQLAIAQTNGTTAVSWPSTLTGFTLETSASLTPPNWQPVTNSPALYGGTLTVTNIPSERASFFRLRKL